MAKQPASPQLNTAYALIISLILLGSLGLAASLLIRRVWPGDSTVADVTFRPKSPEPSVQGARDSTLQANVQRAQSDKIILQITNPTDEPYFFEPTQHLSIHTDNTDLQFQAAESVIVVLSNETKNVDLTGDFAAADTLVIDSPELTATLPLNTRDQR